MLPRSPTVDAFNQQALRHFGNQPVSSDMIAYLARIVDRVVSHGSPPPLTSPCASLQQKDSTPFPSELLQYGACWYEPEKSRLPALEEFIANLVVSSEVRALPLMSTLVYLNRLKSKLNTTAHGVSSTPHRIFLASLVVAVKFLDDSPPKNKHWVFHSSVQTATSALQFTQGDVNKMEAQLICHLDWDLTMSEQDLCAALAPFLEPLPLNIGKGRARKKAWREDEAKLIQDLERSIPKWTAGSYGQGASSQDDRSLREYKRVLVAALGQLTALVNWKAPRTIPPSSRNDTLHESGSQTDEIRHKEDVPR
ncbi:cyclin domain-containing protein [Hirsutella rhossiliensis]|uniref:Cyclin domain-containing protein n=1 Tax=Hirsutella rhossiliensis TaxID=111463 RepID=A0A9P8MR89_9HYPO|nr:cyclin domain-containing protein [Hirsutella rhossiliensis]KAH0957762.1 cyclin domain-containing protein [Hirsutella rhossiliensis]